MTGDSLKRLRTEAGLTQKGLAELVGVSQAHIAKIERGKVDPRLSTVNKVLRVLSEWKKQKCGDIMTRGVIFVKAKDKILDVSEKMVRYAISQVPVMDGGKVVGTVTEESIMRRLGADVVNQTAGKVMTSALPLVDENAGIETVRKLLKTRQGALVARGRKIVGIITRSDLLKAICGPL